MNIENLEAQLFAFLKDIVQKKEKLELLDLTEMCEKSSLFLLPISLYVSKLGLRTNISNFQKELYLPNGLNVCDIRQSLFKAELQRLAKYNSTPIVKFPASENSEDKKNETIELVETTIKEISGIRPNVYVGLKYIVGETIDNITQHSHSEYGYICAYIDKENEFIDLCIADEGVTILGSYKNVNDEDICSDIEALMASNRGISTKNRPDAENRGFGIITSTKMLVEGLGGFSIMISGCSVCQKTTNGNDFIELPEELSFAGTIVFYRIPYNNEKFNYINYIER